MARRLPPDLVEFLVALTLVGLLLVFGMLLLLGLLGGPG